MIKFIILFCLTAIGVSTLLLTAEPIYHAAVVSYHATLAFFVEASIKDVAGAMLIGSLIVLGASVMTWLIKDDIKRSKACREGDRDLCYDY